MIYIEADAARPALHHELRCAAPDVSWRLL